MIRQCVAYDERPPTALGLKDLPVCPFKQGDARLRTVGQLETDGKPRIECHGSAPHDVRASKHVVFTRRTDADGVEMRRSEERRVGKECVITCRSRWSPVHSKKKRKQKKQESP